MIRRIRLQVQLPILFRSFALTTLAQDLGPAKTLCKRLNSARDALLCYCRAADTQTQNAQKLDEQQCVSTLIEPF